MPPRNPLTSSFSVSDANNEVVCPLKNHDGTSCRKRCLGEKRYRSMQEHIRRAHPEHYIAKLPATEESFALMVNTPPSERPRPPQQTSQPSSNLAASVPGYGKDVNSFYKEEYNRTPRSSDEYRRGSILPAANAAEVLAQLHNTRPGSGWDSEQELFSDVEVHRPRAHFGDILNDEPNEFYPSSSSAKTRELLPSSLARTPSGRSSTLPPGSRIGKPNRPRKSSITQGSRKPKHERTKSKEHSRRMSYDRKAMSAEPQSAAAIYGKRWEDLIDAAASATEEDSRDLTPVPHSPQISSSNPLNRSSLPPFLATQFHSYTASPLQNALTPPPPDSAGEMAPFPSVESSIESAQSGQNFHISSTGLSDSSPPFPAPIQIYCAGCHRLSVLKDSLACTECICGLCQDCVDALVSAQARGRLAACPKCNAVGGKFKPFQLDIR